MLHSRVKLDHGAGGSQIPAEVTVKAGEPQKHQSDRLSPATRAGDAQPSCARPSLDPRAVAGTAALRGDGKGRALICCLLPPDSSGCPSKGDRVPPIRSALVICPFSDQTGRSGHAEGRPHGLAHVPPPASHQAGVASPRQEKLSLGLLGGDA